MSQQQRANANTKAETLKGKPVEQIDEPLRGAEASRRQEGAQQGNPRRVQYGQGFFEGHPALPGTDTNLKHDASSPTDRSHASKPKSS